MNGISCIACHRHGIYPFPQDEVLSNTEVRGEALDLLVSLHDSGKATSLGRLDKARFIIALEKSIQPWLSVDGHETNDITSYSEPITPIASFFANSELGIAEVASELGIDEAKLAIQIEHNPNLLNIGLRPLLTNGVVKRDDWQRTSTGPSTFQKTIRHLNLGTPITVLKPNSR